MGTIHSTQDCDVLMRSVIDCFQQHSDPLANTIRSAYRLVRGLYAKEKDYPYPVINKDGTRSDRVKEIPYLQYRVNTACLLAENMHARAEYLIVSLIGPAYKKRLLTRDDVEFVLGESVFTGVDGFLKNVSDLPDQRDQVDERVDMTVFNAAIRDILDGIKKKQRRNNAQTVYINNAYKMACAAHDGVFRQSGEPYIVHPLIVADMLADTGMESEIVAAAILHDVNEDSDFTLADIARISPRVKNYVDAVTSVDRKYKEYLAEKKAEGVSVEQLTKEELDHETVCKLIEHSTADESMSYAMCIKAADRLHNLSTLDGMPLEKIRKKIDETTQLYLPVFRSFGVNYFLDAIEDQLWRLRCSETGEYAVTEKKYEELLSENQTELRAIEAEISTVLTTQLPIQLEQNGGGQMQAELRSAKLYPNQVYRIMKDRISDYNKLRHYINKQTIPLEILNILIDGNNGSYDFGTFINVFIKSLYADPDYAGLSITNMREETVGNRAGIRRLFMEMEDTYHTRIWLYIYLREDYYTYCFGSNEGIVLPVTGSGEPSEMIGEMITVYGRQENEPIIIPAGSTVLDLAFKIHEGMCKYAKSASVNGSPLSEANLTKMLYDGDHVVIEHDADVLKESRSVDPYCKLDWVMAVKLESTRKHIIKWLKQLYETPQNSTNAKT